MSERMFTQNEVDEIKAFYEEKITELEESLQYWKDRDNKWRDSWKDYFTECFEHPED